LSGRAFRLSVFIHSCSMVPLYFPTHSQKPRMRGHRYGSGNADLKARTTRTQQFRNCSQSAALPVLASDTISKNWSKRPSVPIQGL
jgi:hypothetical protein